MSNNLENLSICHEGIQLLKDNNIKIFQQTEIVEMLKKVGCKIAASTLTNIIKYNPSIRVGKRVGSATLLKVARGIEKIVISELGMIYNTDLKKFEKNQENTPLILKPDSILLKKEDFPNNPTFYSGGRRTPDFKISFMEKAANEDTIIEMGLRLNSFSNYFYNTSDEIYKDKIRKLLRRGVNIHCMLLNPIGDFARMYFRRRSKIIPSEMEAYKAMPLIIKKLKQIREEFNSEGYSGKLELLNYDNFPEYHALVVGKQMLISHYIYGVRRSNCPVLEIKENNNPKLFKRYLNSILAIKKGATTII